MNFLNSTCCHYIFTKGKEKGEQCSNNFYEDSKYCKVCSKKEGVIALIAEETRSKAYRHS